MGLLGIAVDKTHEGFDRRFGKHMIYSIARPVAEMLADQIDRGIVLHRPRHGDNG